MSERPPPVSEDPEAEPDSPLVVHFSKEDGLLRTPEGERVDFLDLSEFEEVTTLPEGLRIVHLVLKGCSWLERLPQRLSCYHLDCSETSITSVPDDLTVAFKFDLHDCARLTSLPQGLKTGSLDLSGCTSLTALPEGLDVNFLDLSGCTALTTWPEKASVSLGRLILRGCTRIATLPPWLQSLAQLDISGCERIEALPEGLHISSWLDLAGTALKRLPASLSDVPLRWRGVEIDRRIAFNPETINAAEVLVEENAERRRVLLERCGYDRFLGEAKGEIVDRDTDAGGERKLLRVPMEGDEDLVCVSLICPSTGRQYLVRVPPDTRTCHSAAAWIAGYDDPSAYRPVIET
jgi:hypothetical protein